MLSSLLWFSVLVYAANLFVAPMPHWGSYFTIWLHVLTDFSYDRIKPKHRLKLAYRLVKQFLQMPFWTLCWYIDEWLYGDVIRNEKIEKPVFLFNQPRNGSTYFHRTMAEHDHFFAIKHREWRYPFVWVQKLIDSSPFLEKLVYQDYWEGTGEAGEKARKLHHQTMDDYEEDGCFFEEHFFFHCFNALWNPFPKLMVKMGHFHKLPSDVRTHIMTTHKHVIKKVQYLRKQSRPESLKGQPLFFLSKENESWHRLPEYEQLYPDARYVCIVRPPSQSVPSFCALLAASISSKTGIDMTDEEKDKDGVISMFLAQKRVDNMLHIELFEKKLASSNPPLVSFTLAVKPENIFPTCDIILQKLDMQMTDQFRQFLEQKTNKQKKKKIGGHKKQDAALYTGAGYDEFAEFEQRVFKKHQMALAKYAAAQEEQKS